jgi:hypothetical protein
VFSGDEVIEVNKLLSFPELDLELSLVDAIDN